MLFRSGMDATPGGNSTDVESMHSSEFRRRPHHVIDLVEQFVSAGEQLDALRELAEIIATLVEGIRAIHHPPMDSPPWMPPGDPRLN